MSAAIRILFVCSENSCRSQMAEGFARAARIGGIEPSSAGSRPAGRVDPRAIRLMAERGIDLSAHASRGLADLEPGSVWDYVVTMGCGDECPFLPARAHRDWDLPDPKAMDDDGFREIRDRIEEHVRSLIAEAVSKGSGPAA